MSEQGEIMEHCRGIHNALDKLKWNSLDCARSEQINAIQGLVQDLMRDVGAIPPASRGLRPVYHRDKHGFEIP